MDTTKLTAKDFKDPLMLVLSDLTKTKADFPIEFETTLDPICKLMDITMDQFGNDASSGAPKVRKWIQWAFKDLKKSGYTKTMGRGQWAITDAGVILMGPQTPKDDNQAPAPAAQTTALFSSLQPEETYHEDDYIRTLAAQDSPCFRYYAQQSSTCKECPINIACSNAMMSELVTLSKQLNLQDVAEVAAKKAKANQAGSHSAPAPTTMPRGDADPVLIHQSSVCGLCGGPIPKGTHACWITAATGEAAGLYHPECYDEAKAAGKVT